MMSNVKNGARTAGTMVGILFYLFFSVLPAAGQVEGFLGRWALYLPSGAGWLEVRQEENYLDADIMWVAGSVVGVDSVVLEGETLVITRNRSVVRKRDADRNPTRTQTLSTRLEFRLKDKELIGKVVTPNRNGVGVGVVEFTGKRIPPLPAKPDLLQVKFGEPIELFNGKDISGWTLTNSRQANGFKAVDGALVNDPVQVEGRRRVSYGNIRTEKEFEDFKLKLQVNVPKGSNSGIYLRGVYEVQISDSYQRPLDSHNMGAIYSRIKPTAAAEKPPGQWQDLEITLCDRHVTIILNGITIIDNQPLLGITGGALSADESAPGPIYLQGDHGKVSYRNMILTPIL